jgi:putative membrane protein
MRTSNRRRLTQLALTAAFALPLATVTHNADADQTSAASASDSKLSAADQKFMRKAAMDGMAEVELGRIAAQNGSSDQVKQFGQHMVDDHGKANEELKSLAQTKGVNLPAKVDSKHAKLIAHMEKLSGAAFDRAYMSEMLKDHKTDVAAFKKESTQASDADLKAFAAKTTPTLKAHLQMAQQTSAAVGAGAGSTRTAKGKTSTPANDASGADESMRNRDSTAEGQNRTGATKPVRTNPPMDTPNTTAGAKGPDASGSAEAARNRDSTAPAQQGQKQ